MAAGAIPYIGPIASIAGSVFDFINAGRAANAIATQNQNAMAGVLGASATGQQGVSDAARMGIEGVEHAVNSGQAGVTDALGNANIGLNQAGQQAIGAVNTATGTANAGLQNTFEQQQQQINPYLQAGQTGLSNLQALAAGPGFHFGKEDFDNDPGLAFELEQGQRALQNSRSAQGLGQSGAFAKELAKYSQGLASTHYQDAFNRAKEAYRLNSDTGLANNQALINAGGTGLQNFNTAAINYGNRTSENTMAAGEFAGKTNLGIAELLAKLGIDASQFNSTTGLTGAIQNSNTGTGAAQFNANNALRAAGIAGDYAVGSGTARASGILGQGDAISQGLTGIGSLLEKLLGKK